MDWENERYVRVYTRDTVEWEMLCWEARALWPNLLRKLDRSGRLSLGKYGVRGLAALVKLPVEVVEPGLMGPAGLLEDGCVVMLDGEDGEQVLFAPNFVAAQEAKKSARLRKEEQREREKLGLRPDAQPVTRRDAERPKARPRDQMSQNVTSGHETRPNVTAGHTPSRLVTPSLAKPSLAKPSQDPPLPPQGGGERDDEPPGLELVPPELDPERLTPERLVEAWNEATGGRIRELEEPRRRALRAAIKRQPDLAWWRKCFRKAAEIKSTPNSGWLTLDWILARSPKGWNAERVVEGAFDFRLEQAAGAPKGDASEVYSDAYLAAKYAGL